MLNGFGGDRRKNATTTNEGANYGIECYHVNSRVSRDLEDVGELRPQKIFLLIRFCLSAIWCRFRYGADTLYFIPAPGKRSALLRDWFVMFICRPFFPKTILHWHAAGLGKWLETCVQSRARSFTYKVLKQVDMSIILSEHNRADAEKLLPKHIALVANGIPDPCPNFESELLPVRIARQKAREKISRGESVPANEPSGDATVFRVLYLAHCTKEKGLFDTISGVLKANEKLAKENSPITIHLEIAGAFVDPAEEDEFRKILRDPIASRTIRHLGFVGGTEKNAALKKADLFCFPTFYRNENQPVNLIEAMAYGLPVITTRWRSVTEALPKNYFGIVEPRHPDQIAEVLLQFLTANLAEDFRRHFIEHFTIERHLENLSSAFRSIE
jgi:glycosyltransferase involved in cell wall biosynthesis